jgi:hypothetical protein
MACRTFLFLRGSTVTLMAMSKRPRPGAPVVTAYLPPIPCSRSASMLVMRQAQSMAPDSRLRTSADTSGITRITKRSSSGLPVSQ